jgi:hypothetical protein
MQPGKGFSPHQGFEGFEGFSPHQGFEGFEGFPGPGKPSHVPSLREDKGNRAEDSFKTKLVEKKK